MAVTAQETLEYHRRGRPGKIEVTPTKPMLTQRDLSLAYTPGVAEVVLEIERHADSAYEVTAKANLVAVISNGTAILGLGDRGALASKPVMEGKGVLFKRLRCYIINKAKTSPRRIVFPEGEETAILPAAAQIIDEEIGQPILLGRPDIITQKVQDLGLHFTPEIVDPDTDFRLTQYSKPITNCASGAVSHSVTRASASAGRIYLA